MEFVRPFGLPRSPLPLLRGTILITRKGLLEPLVALLSKKSADSVLESELVDLLGYDDLPLLQAILAGAGPAPPMERSNTQRCL